MRAELPKGYVPSRTEAGSQMAALPPVDRGLPDEPSAFPWKLAGAAMVVLAVGILAGRVYLVGAATPDTPVTTSVSPDASAASRPATAGTTGGLVIDSQPSGAKVTLDGAEVGLTPLKLDAVLAGRHTIAIVTATGTVRRSVRVEAGKLVTLDVPVYSGWLSVFSPIPLEVSSEGKSIGHTDTGKIMLPPGRHLLTLSNSGFGFTDTRTVEIHPGEERPLNVEPKGRVNINAHPWAEVWVDGNKAGDTPIANLQVLLGTRVFVFKHPQYGERRVTATVTTTDSALSVDFTKTPNQP